MAWTDTYRIYTENRLVSGVTVTLAKKDGDAEEVINYKATNIKLFYKGDEGKFANIFGLSLSLGFHVGINDHDPWLEFVTAEKDTWKISILYNEEPIYYGWLLPDEGVMPFRDKPYRINITATDGIGLLKEDTLKKPDGENFNAHHQIIKYIAAITQATGLQLPIRVYDYVFHKSFLNRDVNMSSDFVGQAYLEYRTFQQDASTFYSFYECLERICQGNYRFFQWKGMWVLIRLPMLQYYPFVGYYTEYVYDASSGTGYEITDTYAQFGIGTDLFAINREQNKSMKTAVKSTKSTWNYDVWPELPKNNKFERGTLLQTRQAVNGDLIRDLRNEYTADKLGKYRKYSIDDWEFGLGPENGEGKIELTPTASQHAYRVVIEDIYENIIDEHIIIESEPVTAQLQSDIIPIMAGDKISFDLSFSPNNDFQSGTDPERYVIARAYMITTDGRTIGLTSDGKWHEGERSEIVIDYGLATDTRPLRSVTFESVIAPASGTMYISLRGEPKAGGLAWFKGFNFTVTPYLAGGYKAVKGESQETTQTANYSSKSTEQVYLNANPHKVFKGCLLDEESNPLTDEWYRMGVNESRRYLNLINWGKFNMEHRRMLNIEGPFKGVRYAYENEPLITYPFGLHVLYKQVDLNGDRRFMPCSPIEIDLMLGRTKASFQEIFASLPGLRDGQRLEKPVFKYIF